MTSEYDAIVVGSGLVGGWAAKTLVDRGLKVLLLEAGPEVESARPGTGEPGTLSDIAFRAQAALTGNWIQARGNNFKKEVRHLYVNDRENPYSTPWGKPFLWFRGRQVGGRGHTWGRMCLRVSDHDFAAASRDGVGHDWPLRYADLAPFYDRIEETEGLEGNTEGLECVPDGRCKTSRALNRLEQAFADAVHCRWPERHFISPRVTELYVSPRSLTIDDALKTGRLTLRPDAVVCRIMSDQGQARARGVVYKDCKTKVEHEASARLVFLGASTIETLRILWNSRSPSHGGSLGNSQDLLGRNVMDNNGVLFNGFVPEPAGPPSPPSPIYDLGKVHGFYMPRYQNLKEKDARFFRGFGIQGGIGRDTASWYLFAFGEMLPNPKNRVTLHPRRRDAWGLPIAHIDVAQGENDLKMIEVMEQDLREMIQAGGLEIAGAPAKGLLAGIIFRALLWMVQSRPGVFYPGGAIHETGGAMMGGDPSYSVVNAFNQVWECPNVYVVDGACFPSSVSINPTHTMMALAIRAAEHAAGWLENGMRAPE